MSWGVGPLAWMSQGGGLSRLDAGPRSKMRSNFGAKFACSKLFNLNLTGCAKASKWGASGRAFMQRGGEPISTGGQMPKCGFSAQGSVEKI